MEQLDIFKTIDRTGLRIAFVEYAATGDRPSVTLTPMIHVADKAFYNEAQLTACTADVYLFESAARSWLTWLINRSFRSIVKRFSLTPQSGTTRSSKSKEKEWTRCPPDGPRERSIVYNNCDDDMCEFHLRDVRLVWADLDRTATRQALKQASFGDKLNVFGLLLITPLMIFYLFKKDSRDALIETFDSSWTSQSSKHGSRVFGSVDHYILDARDDYLAACLRREIENPENAGKRIVIQYGGGHMGKLHRMLEEEYGYYIHSRRSILAIARSPEKQAAKPDRNYGSSEELYAEDIAQRIEIAEQARKAELAKRRERRASKRAEKFANAQPAINHALDHAALAVASYANINVQPTVFDAQAAAGPSLKSAIFEQGVDTGPDWRSFMLEDTADEA